MARACPASSSQAARRASDAPAAPPSPARSHHACLPFRRHCFQVHRTAHGDRRDHCWCEVCASWRPFAAACAPALRCAAAAQYARTPLVHEHLAPTIRLTCLGCRYLAGSQRPRAVAPLPDWQQRQGLAVRPAKPHAAAVSHAHSVLQRPLQHPQVRALRSLCPLSQPLCSRSCATAI